MITPERFKEIRSLFADISDKLSEDELNAISDILECSSDVIEIANTRPTATVERLETIGYVHRGTAGLLMEGAVSEAVIIPKAGGDFKHAVVFSEQAEEVIAAKDARIKELEADKKRLREALDMSEAAISEFYRYQYGGEMRGSYDGKPERDGLWKAMYKARAALGEVKS